MSRLEFIEKSLLLLHLQLHQIQKTVPVYVLYLLGNTGMRCMGLRHTHSLFFAL